MIKNKVIANLYLESGCSQKDGEVSVSWTPANFGIFSNLFPDMIQEGVDEWLSENTLPPEHNVELLMQHEMDRDQHVITAEYFVVINVDGPHPIQ